MQNFSFLRPFPHRRRVLKGWEEKISYHNYRDIPKELYWDFIGESGFIGHQTFLYKLFRPTVREQYRELVKTFSQTAVEITQPRAFSLSKIKGTERNNLPARLLENEEVAVSPYFPSGNEDIIFFNAEANEIFYIQEGEGEFQTEFGVLKYEPFDFVLMPKGTFYSIQPKSKSQAMLIIEMPKQYYMPNYGLLSQDYPIAASLIEGGNIPILTSEVNNPKKGKVKVVKKVGGNYKEEIYSNSPLACAGWQGTLYPFKINATDINVVESHTFHLPPSAYVTFLNENGSVNIITFLPRFVHTPPYNHRNTSYNEFMFYSKGTFISRSGIGVGDITLHPIGGHHGPQPKKEFFEVKSIEEYKKHFVDEIAVMIESQPNFRLTPLAKKIEIEEYALSWHKESIEVS